MGSLAAQLYRYVIGVRRGVIWWEGGWKLVKSEACYRCFRTVNGWVKCESGFLDCFSFGIEKQIRAI